MSAPDLDTEALWAIFDFIGTNWDNAGFCAMTQAQFVEVVNWQAQRDPQYAGYYATAVSEYQELLAQYGGDQQEALTALYAQNQAPYSNPAVGQCVLLEFMRWQVAFGGFKSFGYMNYTGWMGGGSFLTVPPPYRALATGSTQS